MPIDYEAAFPVLRHAANLINTDGWTVGSLKNENGCFCVHGAISFAATGHADWVETFFHSKPDSAVQPTISDPRALAAMLVLYEYLSTDPQPYHFDGSRGRDPGSEVASWNDYQAGSGEVVTAAMRAAAVWAERRAQSSA